MHNEYFEGILQLRNPKEEIIRFIINQVKKEKNVFITKEKKVPNGIDFYITSQKFIQNLGKKLKKSFQGELKVSSKLFSRNHLTSKDVYRMNVLFRVAKYKSGDTIDYKGEKVKIVKMGKKILAKEISTGKKVNLDYKDL